MSFDRGKVTAKTYKTLATSTYALAFTKKPVQSLANKLIRTEETKRISLFPQGFLSGATESEMHGRRFAPSREKVESATLTAFCKFTTFLIKFDS
jgi:hypothetical protein